MAVQQAAVEEEPMAVGQVEQTVVAAMGWALLVVATAEARGAAAVEAEAAHWVAIVAVAR